MIKRWKCKDLPDEAAVVRLAAQLSIEEPLAALLIQRGITTPEAAGEFFNPDIGKLHDPFLMKDMDKAVARLSKAVINNEKIMILGDYDVDGTSAVALLYSFLCEIIGTEYTDLVEYYIPNRYTEGYGVSDKCLDYCRSIGVTLLITLDCGIKANDKVDKANAYGIDVIISDHHYEGDELPKAVAILNPKRKDCTYPYKDLSGCGVGFKLIQGYCQQFGLPDQLWLSKMDLVAMSIASDIVAITGENRILAHYGLKIVNTFPRMGVKSILAQVGIHLHYPFREETIFSRVISISDIVFYIAPRINAAGRMKTGRESVRLFICEDEDKSVDIGNRINTQNEERKEQDRNATEEAIQLIRSSPIYERRKSIVVYNPNWFKGIVGIVASRLVEEFYKPAIVLTKSADGLITGSARSVNNFNIYEGIEECSDLLEHFGGHKYAAGLAMKEENLEEFTEKFEQYVQDNIEETSAVPEISVDMPLDLAEITPSFMKNLKRFAPFGPGNMNPIFQSDGVVDEGNAHIVGDKHLKMRVMYPDRPVAPVEAIAFNMRGKLDVAKDGRRFDMLYHVEENLWNNVANLQLNTKDIRPHGAVTENGPECLDLHEDSH